MREISYRHFSQRVHKRNWQQGQPNMCQFELTFACGLHCRYCYTDCYNRFSYLKKELKTEQVKIIIDKVRRAGLFWISFTGGDPLTRDDFLEIYAHAKDRGLFVILLTNGYSMTRRIAKALARRPPFVIEMTLNAVSPELYEKMSGVKGSFQKTMRGMELILDEGLSLKIKTQITKENPQEIPKIKKFLKRLGLRFHGSTDLHARLDGDPSPCRLRVTPEQAAGFRVPGRPSTGECATQQEAPLGEPDTGLFRCAVTSADGFYVDPYGRMSVCQLVRKPAFDLLKIGVQEGRNRLLTALKKRSDACTSRCRRCRLVRFCESCPGRAFVETGDMGAVVPYHCQLAEIKERRENLIRQKGGLEDGQKTKV